jgi:hypothetical protein
MISSSPPADNGRCEAGGGVPMSAEAHHYRRAHMAQLAMLPVSVSSSSSQLGLAAMDAKQTVVNRLPRPGSLFCRCLVGGIVVVVVVLVLVFVVAAGLADQDDDSD